MHLRGVCAVLLLGNIVALSSCTPAPPQGDPPSSASAMQIAALQKKIDDAQQEQKKLRAAIDELRLRRQFEESQYQSAEFDPAQPGYQRIDANYGSFAVALSDVRQFADSVKIRLNIGNLSSATFTGVRLTLRYGSRPPDMRAGDWSEQYSNWQSGLKSKEETLVQNIRPANWNPVQVVLPGIEEKQFGYLEVKIQTNTIQLFQ